MYGVIGIFGAARYGDRTEGNILVNSWLGGPAEGVLDLAIAAYLSISVPPMQVGLAEPRTFCMSFSSPTNSLVGLACIQ